MAFSLTWIFVILFLVTILASIYIARLKVYTYARTSLIFTIFFWLPAINLITASLALVFGFVALKDIKTNKQKGRGLAIAGITIAIVTIILSIVGFILNRDLFLSTAV